MSQPTAPKFNILRTSDGTWQAFLDEWKAECEAAGQDFEEYGVATLGELGRLADQGHERAEVFALKDNGKYVGVCQGNCTPLPGYSGKVLRIRFMTFSPEYDFGNKTVAEYASVLVGMFTATLNLSFAGGMKAKHIKFHLRSPADIQFFAALGTQLNQSSLFEIVETKGAWLYITKN